MKISEMLLPEYDLEVVNTRKLLERVPRTSSLGSRMKNR